MTTSLLTTADPCATLRAMMSPRSIAVIGASRDPAGMGNRIVHNLISSGFTGAVYPVNPRASSVCSVRAYATIADCPDVPDLALVVVPKEHFNAVARRCERRSARVSARAG